MTRTAAPAIGGTAAAGSVALHPNDLRPSAWAQLRALSGRAIRGSTRQLPLLVPSMLFPLFFVAINTSSFNKSLPLLRANGYPKLDSFLTFTLAATVVQGVMFGSVQGATDLATDIEGGFFERMIAAPASRVTILVARLAGGLVLGAFQAVLFTVALVLFGARVEAGIAGAVVMIVSATLLGLAFGALLAAIAIRSGSAEAVQSTFPIVFVLLFASSAFFPRQTMTGWFKRIAGINPLTHTVEPMRDLVVNGWSTTKAVEAVVIPAGMAVFTIALALLALRRRLKAL